MSDKQHPAFARLVEIMAALRSPNGCPWDREQTPQTLKPYLVEETYEALEALEAEDWSEFKEELGDLLLQIVFHSQLMAEAGEFSIDDVAQSIADKMTRRHPHVFGDLQVANVEEVSQNWAKIKAQERQEKHAKKNEKGTTGQAAPSILTGVPKGAPALIQAQRLGEKAARVGFDWPSAAAVFEKVTEEYKELEETLLSADHTQHQEHELGDLLFALTSLARHLNLDAESALRKANGRFHARFHYIEQKLLQNQEDLYQTSLPRLEELWQEAKRTLG